MTDTEFLVIEQAIKQLDLALTKGLAKELVQALVWEVRENLRDLTKTNLGEAKNVQTKKGSK